MVEKLTGAARQTALRELHGWSEVEDRDAIRKSYHFSNFSEAWGFLSRIALAADTAGAAATIGSLPPRPPADHEATYWGRNQPPLLGIMSRPLDQQEKDRLLRSDGMVVELVTNDSPAAAAHIQQGDIILAIDGKPILDARAVPAFLRSIAGRRVRIDLLRDSTPHTVEVQLNPAAP